MAGVILKADFRNLDRRLRALGARFANPKEFLERIAEKLLQVARRSFEREASPEGRPWVRLTPAYAERKQRLVGRRNILQFSGTLVRSLHRGVQGNQFAFVSTGQLPYARIHQFGGQAGRGHWARIPARPYLGFPPAAQKEVAEDIEQLLEKTAK